MTENFLYFTQVYDSSGFMAWAAMYTLEHYIRRSALRLYATVGMGIGLARNSTKLPSGSGLQLASFLQRWEFMHSGMLQWF